MRHSWGNTVHDIVFDGEITAGMRCLRCGMEKVGTKVDGRLFYQNGPYPAGARVRSRIAGYVPKCIDG